MTNRRHRMPFPGHAAAALALWVVALAFSSALPESAPAAARLFSPNGVWNRPLAPNARIDPDSAGLVRGLVREVDRTTPWIGTDSYSTPLYVVGASQPHVRVALDQPSVSWRRSLQRAFSRVPIPPHARPADGTDGHLTVWQPSKDRLWEFWRMRRQSGRWHATWGGAMKNVSRNPGYYTPSAWPGLARLNWGATASSLPMAGGVMLIGELRSGWIRHALRIAIPNPRAREYSWPAQRTDGRGPSSQLPEGARLRLPPGLDLKALGLPRFTLMMARAAKRYGIIVVDRGGDVGFLAEDPAGRPDPYYGPGGLFGGLQPNQILARFPWERLRVLKMSLCSDPSRLCRRR